ncbi:MAG: TonB-dependent receptor [Rhodobacteraceae bacterium]|nr:TonB-dependent receptor [Paracoccaceae bacterium]
MKRMLLGSIAATALLSGLNSSPSFAQVRIEEIVVTARKTEERLQDIPLSITAFTSAELEERGMKDVYEISNFTSSFTFERLNRYGVQGGTSRPVIRGQSNILGESNAAVFVDGLLMSDSILSFPFDIVERVEIIKGPQAALFGRATFAGAINLITKKGSNDFQNRISVRAAEDDDYEVNLLSRGPIIEDKAFYMIHGRYYDFGGQYKDASGGQPVGAEESAGIDGSLEFRLGDSFTANFAAGYGKDNDSLSPNSLQNRFANNCFLDVARQYYCGKVQPGLVDYNIELLQGKDGLDKESYRVTGQLQWDVGGFTITSNSGYFYADNAFGTDADFSGVNTSGGSNNRLVLSTRKEWSTELRIQSPAQEKFRYLAGAYYYKRRLPLISTRLDGGASTDSGTDRVNNWALFASLAADFTDGLTGTVELRYAKDKIGNNNPTARPTTNTLIERSFKSWSPRFTLDWQVYPDSKVYATAAKGNKPGVINADPRLPDSIRFADEESSWNYEIGTKNTLMDGRLLINAAGYYIDWSKQQLTTNFFFDTTGTTVSYLVNAGTTRIYGLEFEMTAVANEYLSTGFNYSLNDAKFTDFIDSEHGQLFGDPQAAGKSTPNSSKHQFSLFGRLNYPMANETVAFLRADFSYKERKYAQIYNLAHTGDQKLLNLKVGVERDDWNVTLFLDNVFDDRTPSTAVRFVDFANILPIGTSQRTSSVVRGFQVPLARKRQFGVTANYSF